MRYLFHLIFGSLIMALASCHVQDRSIDIGDGLVLEIEKRTFRTIGDNTRCEQLLEAMKRGVIPDRFAQTETVIVQVGFTDIKVTPIIYSRDGSVKTAAKAKLLIIPAVSKQVPPPIITTSSKDGQSKTKSLCKPIIRRVILKPKSYKLKDASGAIINKFETEEALAEYINSR